MFVEYLSDLRRSTEFMSISCQIYVDIVLKLRVDVECMPDQSPP